MSVVANYPILNLPSTENGKAAQNDGRRVLIYIGDLDRSRGLDIMFQIAALLEPYNVELKLMGHFQDPKDEQLARQLPNVRYFGFQPLDVVYQHLSNADLGLVLLQPTGGYRDAGENTTKLFDYMGCGLPVVASDFPNLRRIVEDAESGICVDPCCAETAAREILSLLRQPDHLRRLGGNGRRAVRERYNWAQESKNLLRVYAKLVGTTKNGEA